MKLPTDHVTLTSQSDVKNICSHLEILNVNFFCYSKFYLDGSTFTLLSDDKWYQSFLAAEVPKCVNVFQLPHGSAFWHELFPEESVKNAQQNFNINHALNFHDYCDDYIEVLTYSTNLQQDGAEYLLANSDLLEKFNTYFKNTAKKLIQTAESVKIQLPQGMLADAPKQLRALRVDDATRQQFLKRINPLNQFDHLTAREKDCFEIVAHGLTLKQTARKLGISERTVEYHLNNVKDKFNCISKSQLASIYWNAIDKA